MSELNPTQSISGVVTAIHHGKYRLPNIQRGYEWNEDRVTKLLDSIMSGYPIGAIMVWSPTAEIRNDIRTRQFVTDFESTQDYRTALPHASEPESYLVLDGQQRLQSLYVSFFGSYNKQRLYFQIDHVPTDVDDDTDYVFKFLTREEAKSQLAMVPLFEIVKLDPDTKLPCINNLVSKLCGSIVDPVAHQQAKQSKFADIWQNVDRFIHRFNVSLALLFQEVGQNLNYGHVLPNLRTGEQRRHGTDQVRLVVLYPEAQVGEHGGPIHRHSELPQHGRVLQF
jgi:hypothetical protein